MRPQGRAPEVSQGSRTPTPGGTQNQGPGGVVGEGAQGSPWLILGIDVNRDYLSFGVMTPSLRMLWGFADYYLGRLQSSPLTRPLIRQVNRLGPLRGLLPFQLMGPLRLGVVFGNGVRVLVWAYAMLVPLPPRLGRRVRCRRGHVRRWRRVTIRYLITSLSPYIRKSNTMTIIILEDLRGMAEKRGITEIEYSRIWRYALGTNLERQPIINKGHHRVYVGRSGSIVIAIDPRDTSSVCFLSNAEGRETRVKEYSDRTIECNGKLRLNRDINASLNIAIEGLRIFTWHYRTIMSMWLEINKAMKALKPGDWARAPRGDLGRGALGASTSPTPKPQ